MCCPNRKVPVLIMMIVSGLGCLGGLLMIIFSALLTNNPMLKNMGKQNSTLEDGRKMIFTALLIFSLMTTALAALGFCCRCVKNRCLTVLYGIILFPAFLVVMIFGLVGIAVGGAAKESFDNSCVSINNSRVSSYSTSTRSGSTAKIDFSLDIYDSLRISTDMCTNNCPCKSISDNIQQAYSSRYNEIIKTNKRAVRT